MIELRIGQIIIIQMQQMIMGPVTDMVVHLIGQTIMILKPQIMTDLVINMAVCLHGQIIMIHWLLKAI